MQIPRLIVMDIRAFLSSNTTKTPTLKRARDNSGGSHESSTGQTHCVAAAKVAENPRLSPLPRALLSLSEEVSQNMERLFDIAYFVAKREMPFTSFPHPCKLEMKHGVELGNTYINNKACKTFVTSIAGQLKHELSSKFQSSKFISVMADSACDVELREAEGL